MAKVSSGTAAVATTTADATPVILAASLAGTEQHASIVSAVAGFFSLDGGISWDRIEANARLDRYHAGPIKSVTIKRDGATDMTGVYASVW
jgi:hypothetical protein